MRVLRKKCQHLTDSSDGDRYCEKYKIWLETILVERAWYEGVRADICIKEHKTYTEIRELYFGAEGLND